MDLVLYLFVLEKIQISGGCVGWTIREEKGVRSIVVGIVWGIK